MYKKLLLTVLLSIPGFLALWGNVNRFVYEEQPNGGAQTILGLAFGNEFLGPFQYIVEVDEEFRAGEVEVVFYNQFGQVIQSAQIKHPPFNSTTTPEPQITKSPTMPMFEGRTQLLGWSRIPPGSQVIQEINTNGTIVPALNGVTVACRPSGNNPCEVTFTPPGTTFSTPTDGTTTPVGNLPGNVSVTSVNGLAPLTVSGTTQSPSDWFFGPHVFQDGPDAGEFIFIDSDQGPPDSPFLNFFECQGTSTCIDAPLAAETPRALLDTDTNRFRFKVVFNKRDIFNATDVNGTGVPLTVRFHGSVRNNPALWRDTDGTIGLPGAVPKPESNAFVDAFLLPVRFTNSTGSQPSVRTTGTGPFFISVTGVNPTIPQVEYPDDVDDFSYNSPIYPSETPFPVKYPFGASLAPGLFQTMGFDFTSLLDGDYEIFIGAEDALSTITNNGQSPGEINASGQRVPGVTTAIQVIKDGVAPNSFSVQIVPTRRFLIFGDQADPPLPYDEHQGEIFQLRGNASDERNDPLTMEIDLTRDDGTVITNPTKNGHFDEIPTINGLFSRFYDFSNVDPDSQGSPVPPHTATGGQRGYQITVYPVDPQGNVSETTAPLYLIKDLQAPQNPRIISPPPSTILTGTSLGIRVESPNEEITLNPFLDLREHGFVKLTLTLVDESGRASVSTTTGQGIFQSTTADASSRLDDHPSWNKSPGPFGGQGVTGVDFFGNVPDRFEYFQRVNIEELADGFLTVIASLTDEVGNPSVLTSSVVLFKDSTGPSIIFDAAHRQDSGPDNNYPVPNFTGADDDEYLISLLSPELTVDFGPGSPVPATPDPGGVDSLHIEGIARDGFSSIQRVEIRGNHIPDLLANLDSTTTTTTDFQADIPISGLLEGVRELIKFQGFDQQGKPGAIRSVSVFRDVTPAEAPTILEPVRLPTDSKTIVYSATDRLRISGIFSARDTALTSLADGTVLRSKIVVLTPPEDPSAFTTGDLVPRVPRTQPSRIPRLDSALSSFPLSLTSAHFDLVSMEDDGSFSLEVDISTIPQNAFIPTTIWVQAIDGFENTDPNLSAVPIEVFYLPGGAPVARLTVLNFRGSGQDIQVFPPDSLPGSLLQTFFVGLEEVRFELQTFIPMVEAPSLSIQQFGAQTRGTNLLSSVDQVRGSTSFVYSYAVLPQRGQFDGPGVAFIEEGKDLFGNGVLPLIVTTAIQVDSLPPNIVTTPQEFEAVEIPPAFDPPHGSRVRLQSLTISADFDDFLPSNGSVVRSGIDTSTSELSLAGPLLESPDIPVNIISVPPAPGYEISVQVVDTLRDGVYRASLKARDRVGNEHIFYSSFVFDQTPVSAPLLITNPANGSTVASLPLSASSQFLELQVERIDVNLPATGFELIDPAGSAVALSSRVELSESRIRQSPVTSIVLDGSLDGLYQIPIEVFDLSGNRLEKIHQFLLDSKAPRIGEFFPANGTCVGPTQDIFDVQVADLPGRTDLVIPVAGISDQSLLELVLEDSGDPTRPLTRELIVGGETRLISGNDQDSSAGRKIAFLPKEGLRTRTLAVNGSEDGKYRLQARVLDGVGNISSQTSTFFLDTLAPEISIQGLSDGKLVGVTTGFQLDLGGRIQDRGFCHFFVEGEAYQGRTTLEIEIFQLNSDTLERSAIFQPRTPILDLTRENPEFSIHSAQASWRYSTFVPFIGTLTNQIFEVELSAMDQVGNRAKIQRVFELVDRNRAIPAILSPPAFSVVDSKATTFRTSQEVLTVRWQNIRGTRDVELEVFRHRVSSQQPFIERTYPSHLQESAPLSLSKSLPISGLETFSLRIRGKDGDGLFTEWSSPQFFEVDRRDFQVQEVYLLQDSKRLPLSRGEAFLTSNEIQLEVLLNKRFLREPTGFFQLRLAEMGEDQPLKSVIPTTLLTNHFFLEGGFELPSRGLYPRLPFTLTISNLSDLVQRSLTPYQLNIPVDFGPEPYVKVFSNPVNPREIIAVIRFLSIFGRLERVRVIRENGKIISPAFTLKKGDFRRDLQPVPIEETSASEGGLAHSFSLPLEISPDDTGFYYLEMHYKDQVPRTHLKEREITVGRFIASRGLILETPSSGLKLSSKSRAAPEGIVYLVGNIRPLREKNGEIELLHDLDVFGGTRQTIGEKVILDLSGMEMSPELSSAAVFQLKEDRLEYTQQWEASRAELTLGSRYVLGRDLVPPQWEWSGRDLLGEGYQKLPLKVSDHGSGIRASSLKVQLGERELSAKILDGEVWVDLRAGSDEQELGLSVEDRSGLRASMQRNIQVIKGWGIRSAQMVPNPVRSGQQVHLNYFVEGVASRVTARIYDASGSLLKTLEGPAEPGRNRLDWDLTTRRGDFLRNGVYFFRLSLEGSGRRAMRSGKFAVLY